MLQYQLQILLQNFLGLVLGEEQHIEAGMRGGEVGGVGVALDEELQRFEALDRHAVGSSHKGQEVLLFLEVEFVKQLPKMSE